MPDHSVRMMKSLKMNPTAAATVAPRSFDQGGVRGRRQDDNIGPDDRDEDEGKAKIRGDDAWEEAGDGQIDPAATQDESAQAVGEKQAEPPRKR